MSSYLKRTLPPEERWRVSLPQVAVSQDVTALSMSSESCGSKEEGCPLTHSGRPDMSKDFLLLNSPSLPAVSSPCP